MIRHFFLDKTATIIKGKLVNTGLNPILSINYGVSLSRGLLHFNNDEIKSWIDENQLNYDKLSFRLKMTNCSGIDSIPYDKKIVSAPDNLANRASSFSLELHKISKPFDAGRGFEYDNDFAIDDRRSYSEFGANWKYCSGKTEWDVIGCYDKTKRSETLVNKQHFDFGNENIDIDITDYVLSTLENNNNGLLLKYEDLLEETQLDEQQYVGFFTDKTNTFFHPYIEAIYDDYINDDREAFFDGKKNRLYLYVNDNGMPAVLDNLPTCTIDDETYNTEIAQAGAYYVEIDKNFNVGNTMPIKYDVWSNIVINGKEQDDVEMEFVVLPKTMNTQIGNVTTFKDMTVPTLFGINDNEEVNRGEIREVVVDFRRKYTTDKKVLNETSEYRIYVKDGLREHDVFDYQHVEKAFLNNFFIVNTSDLIPNKYYIDIRTKVGRELRYYKDVLHFIVKDNLTERYH